MSLTKWETENRERIRFDRIFDTDFKDCGGVVRREKADPAPNDIDTPRLMRNLARLMQAVNLIENPPNT